MMNAQKKEQVKYLRVTEGLEVAIILNTNHEFLMSTKEVAKGYGVARQTISWHASQSVDEIKEGVHFLKGVNNTDSDPASNTCNDPANKIYWTKAGVIRLGMFIRSERAVAFRNWAEAVILREIESPKPVKAFPKVVRRKHNRITPERLISIMADVCLIKDTALRTRIASKIEGGYWSKQALPLFPND